MITYLFKIQTTRPSTPSSVTVPAAADFLMALKTLAELLGCRIMTPGNFAFPWELGSLAQLYVTLVDADGTAHPSQLFFQGCAYVPGVVSPELPAGVPGVQTHNPKQARRVMAPRDASPPVTPAEPVTKPEPKPERPNRPIAEWAEAEPE